MPAMSEFGLSCTSRLDQDCYKIWSWHATSRTLTGNTAPAQRGVSFPLVVLATRWARWLAFLLGFSAWHRRLRSLLPLLASSCASLFGCDSKTSTNYRPPGWQGSEGFKSNKRLLQRHSRPRRSLPYASSRVVHLKANKRCKRLNVS